jgi:single-strand DNA-binding protein
VNNLNSVLIEGELSSDPELSYTPKGVAVCKFTVASSRMDKEEEEPRKEVSRFDVTTRARLAEACAEYLKAGRGVRVVGRLKSTPWNAGSPAEHWRVVIVAEHVEFKPTKRTADAEHAAAAAL